MERKAHRSGRFLVRLLVLSLAGFAAAALHRERRRYASLFEAGPDAFLVTDLDGKVLEPGPLLLQGDHGRVAFRNIKIRPLPRK